MSAFLIIYRTKKRIFTYKKYTYNSSQSDFDLFVNYIYAEIVIIPIKGLNFIKHYDKMTLVV